MRGLTLTQREQTRLQVLNRLVTQQLTTSEAATILGLSERHTRRMLAAYRKEGAAALAHGNRGRRPDNSVVAETRRKVIALARTRYAGFNHTHLSEIMSEREGLVLSRSTVRSILLSAGLPSPRYRRPPRHRHILPPKDQEGMLLQLDGSYHAWLDDATGTVPYGVFREREDTHGYFELLEGIIARHPSAEGHLWAYIRTATLSSNLRARGLRESLGSLPPPNGAAPFRGRAVLCGSSA